MIRRFTKEVLWLVRPLCCVFSGWATDVLRWHARVVMGSFLLVEVMRMGFGALYPRSDSESDLDLGF